MKKSLFIISAAAVLLTGCAKEQLVEKKLQNGPVIVVSATFEDLVGDDATKAAVADAGTFTWQNGDKAAFAGESAYLEAQNSSTTATASFSYSGTLASSTFGIFPFDLTTGQSVNDGKVKVPTSRAWAENQTNVAMYATYASNNFNFDHLGGLVKVTINNIPTTANKFVFKTKGWKINGVFDIDTDTDGKKKISASSTTTDSEMEYTLTFTAPQSAGTTMTFYVPLPVGTYDKGFAVYLKNGDTVLSQFKGSTSQSVNRKSFLIMPAITLASASIENVYKDALVETIPAGYSGDYLLPKTDKLVLKIKASNDDHDITLKYNGENIPTKLEIKVVDGDSENAGDFNAKLIGDLRYTHVDFTLGKINRTELTTSASTFAVIHPATVGTLTVKGGNVVLQGATVNMIEVAEGAVADKTSNNPIEIKMENDNAGQTPAVTGSIVARASVKVAPVDGQTVSVVTVGNATAEKIGTGTGTIEINGDEVSVSSFDKFEEAVRSIVAGQTIKVTAHITDAKGITVDGGKNFTVDFGGFTYTCASDPAGSDGTKNQVFQLLKGSTITFKNGTINVKEEAKSQFRFIIQNYANLTLEDITLDGTNLAISDGRVNYTVSNYSGSVEFKGKTNIKAAATKGVAFDAWDDPSYDGVPQVTVNTTGTIEGQVEVTGGTLVVEAGTFKTTGARRSSTANHQSPTLLVTSGNVTVNGGSFTSEHDVAVRAEGGTVTLNNGTFTAPEGAVCFPGVGANINIKGGTYTASDNAVIIGQGSAKDGDANTVNISGGTFTGNISSSGYIACGIYAPWKDNIKVSGGTFNITNGAGVVARAGVVTIEGGVFNCTGTATGKVGDKDVQIPCEPLYYDDSEPDYPGRDKATSKIIATGGSFSKEPAAKYIDPAYTVKKEGEYYKVVELPVGALKGVFTANPEGKKVHFSKGNLTYDVNASTNKWKFYEHQYDCATGYDPNLISLFTWGYNENTSTDPAGEEYVTGHTTDGESFSASEDWGSQIGDGKTWRTLTEAEWQYLFNTREASTVSGTQNARYAKATVGSISGIILLPDKYEHPSGVAALTNINTSDAGYTANSYDVTTWAAMEDAGAVFLPAADYREGDEVDYGNTFGSYWSSTACSAEYAYCVEFDSTNSNVDPENNYLDPEYVDERAYGCSVRLVTESN